MAFKSECFLEKKLDKKYAARLFIGILVLLLGITSKARAQKSPTWSPMFDASGMYSYVRADGDNSRGHFNLNGGSASLGYGFNDTFAIVADLGAYRFGTLPFGITSNMYTYMFGPRVTLDKFRKIRPFTQVLVGGGRLNAGSGSIHAGENGFAMAIGGGLDLPIHERFAIRLVQAEYLLTRFNGQTSPTQSNVRISAGFVLRFGGR